MTRSITVRDIGDETGDELASRAVATGRSLQEYLRAALILPVEVANILQRASLRGDISADTASLAHADLLNLQIELFPYAPIAERAMLTRATNGSRLHRGASMSCPTTDDGQQARRVRFPGLDEFARDLACAPTARAS
jgi:predicted nucleic acid-binding protein